MRCAEGLDVKKLDKSIAKALWTRRDFLQIGLPRKQIPTPICRELIQKKRGWQNATPLINKEESVENVLTFRKLEAFAGAGKAIFLTLAHTGVSREKS